MAYIYSFEKLEVWQLSRKLIVDIYRITRDFPEEEKFGLISQLRRASISVASNLAEGTSRETFKDKAHFSQISYSSLMEVLCQLIISCDLEYISIDVLINIRLQIDEIANKLNALRNFQLKS